LYFINEITGWVVDGQKIYRTTDGGSTIQLQYNDSLNEPYFRSVAFNTPQLGWVGSLEGLLYKTTNAGTNWVRVDTLINPRPVGICDISVVGNNVFYGAGKYSGPTNLIKSTDAGATFEYIDMGAYASQLVGVKFFTVDSGYIVGRSNIISEGAVVLFTSNGGDTWVKRFKSFVQPEHAWNITFINSLTGYASIENYSSLPAVIKTTNGGINWVRKSLPSFAGELDPIGFVNAFTGWTANHAGGFGMWQTTNGGDNWTQLNNNARSIHTIQLLNDSIGYAGGYNFLKYTRSLVGIISNTTYPKQMHSIKQNFPNPFNPSTIIRYSLYRKTHILLEIYNANGEFITTLESGYRNAGDYNFEWNAGNLPSGVYFYNLLTDEGNFSGKAVLLK
ncbi:MAG TPA: T9SS type A sorting domain-containing protein, partial [Ignavibacteria bacterium]